MKTESRSASRKRRAIWPKTYMDKGASGVWQTASIRCPSGSKMNAA